MIFRIATIALLVSTLSFCGISHVQAKNVSPNSNFCPPGADCIYHPGPCPPGADCIYKPGPCPPGAYCIIPPVIQPVSCTLTHTLKLGMTGTDVICLQKILSLYPSFYPQKIISGYYGHLTQMAVEQFQLQEGIISSGPGLGIVGPRTLKVLVK